MPMLSSEPSLLMACRRCLVQSGQVQIQGAELWPMGVTHLVTNLPRDDVVGITMDQGKKMVSKLK